MTITTVTINDTLNDRIETAKANAEQVLIQWLEENKDHDPELTDIDLNDLNSIELNAVYEAATPIYIKEIKAAWAYMDQDWSKPMETLAVVKIH